MPPSLLPLQNSCAPALAYPRCGPLYSTHFAGSTSLAQLYNPPLFASDAITGTSGLQGFANPCLPTGCCLDKSLTVGTFAKDFLPIFRSYKNIKIVQIEQQWTPYVTQGCHVGIIAMSDPADKLLYTDPLVDLDLRYDLDTPSIAFLEAVHFMHKAAYTHVIIQQVWGLPVTLHFQNHIPPTTL